MGPNNFYEVLVVKAIDLNSVADVTGGTWSPGFKRHKIHGVALAITNAIGAAGVVKVDKRPTVGDDTGRGDGDIAVINLGTAHTLGKVVYKAVSPPVTLDPGQEAVFQVTDATAASDTANAYLLVEIVPEEPANITAMVATT